MISHICDSKNELAKLEDAEASSQNWIVFGCRHEKKDFLFKDELVQFKEKGVLEKILTAFSRDSDQKVYVQHKLEEHGKDIVNLMLNKNAIVYICG